MLLSLLQGIGLVILTILVPVFFHYAAYYLHKIIMYFRS